MMGDGSQIDPVANLVEEFLERYRRGERPSVTEYTQRFPELGERVREVLPMMVMIEQAGLTETDKPALEPPSAATSGTGGIPQQVGDYRILREIGKGGMGVVYEAEQLSLGRRVALKFLSRHIAHDAKLMERFRREARAAAQLHHTNIVPVFDVGQQDGICYYAMQRIQGHPLDQVLVELRQLRSGSADIKHPAQPADADTPTAVQIAHSLRSGLQLTEPAVQGAPCEAPDDSSPLQSPIDRAARTVHSAAELTKVSSAVLPGQSPLSRTESDGWHYYRSVAEVGVQVADALAYAHQEGIIHRDIKPSNLLLDTQGTAWVTDFGLAKHQDDGLTRTGDIVGTLRYMAPERFRGWSDPRSDVYSLGITLYEMLALRPAFDKQDRLQLIQQITHDGPPRLRAADPRIPADLETIVLKAIEREPQDRYPSAAELEADLQRFLQDKPIGARRASQAEQFWRWCRRNPAIATLTGLIGLLLVALAAGSLAASFHFRRSAHEREQISILAVNREQQAQRNLQTALDAVNRFFVQVSEDSRLKSVGLETVRRDLLETGRELFAQLAQYEGDHPELLAEQAKANLSLAMITRELGSTDEAVALFGQGKAILKRLVVENPDVAEYRKLLAQLFSDLGNTYQHADRYTEAEGAHRRALELRRQLVQEDPDRSQYVHNLSMTHNNLGIVYYRTDRSELAEAEYQESLKRLQPLVAMQPDQLDYHLSMGKVLNNLGVLYRATGRAEEAERILQQAVSLHRKLVRQQPDLPVYRYDLALSLNNVAKVFHDTGRMREAEAAFREAIALRKELAEVHPDLPGYQMDSACSHCGLAGLYRATGNLEQAAAMYEDIVAAQERLVAAHPQAPQYLASLSHHLNKLGIVCQGLKRYEDAERAYRRAIEIRKTLVHKHPETISYQADLGGSYNNLGRYFRSRRELQESLTWYEKGGRTLQAARQAAPDDRKVRKYLYSSLGGHASILYQLGRFEAAIPVYEQATELGPQIARDHPRDPQWNQRLHGHWYFLGLCLEIQQQHERSEFAFRKAAEVAEALIQTHPEQLEYQLTFGERCWWIGDYVRQGGRPRDALGWFTRSLEILEPLQQQLPENAKARLYLGRAYQGRAQSYEQLDEPQKAAEAREQAKKFQ